MWPVDRLRRAAPSAVADDKALALVEAGGRGLLITAVNATALSQGLYPGLTLADARAAFPALLSRRAETDKDRIALLKLARWAGRYGPCRHVDGASGLWIDITGVAHLFGGEDALVGDLIGRLQSFGVSARAGLADTFGAAHALARFATGRDRAFAIAPAGETRLRLAPLPVEGLRLEAETVRLLKRLGLRRIGELYDLPRDSLARRFRSKDEAGRVLTRLDCALGVKSEPLRPLVEPPVLSTTQSFAEPLMSSEALHGCVEVLCGEVCTLLAGKALGARSLRLSLYRADGTVAEVFAALSAPSREVPHILRLINEKMAPLNAGFGIDVMRLDVVRAERLDAQETSLAGNGRFQGHASARLIDRLSNRLGAEAITVLRPQASHLPERADKRAVALSAVAQMQPANRNARVTHERAPRVMASTLQSSTSLAAQLAPECAPEFSPAGLAYEPPWPYAAQTPDQTPTQTVRRPPFLLPRPEPIDVLAEVPDGPPARFTWRRVERRVARAEGPERLAPEWWRHLRAAEGSKPARPRDYYMIEDETGAAYWVFRHGLYGREDDDPEGAAPPSWFLHGLFA